MQKKLDAYNHNNDVELDRAYSYISLISGLDNDSIINACKLARYDVCARASCEDYKYNYISPDEYAISNIRIMVMRSIKFFNNNGGVTDTNITFENAYTAIISSGDADYLTPNGLWDMKVSIYELNSKNTLQLLVYYLMGLKSNPQLFNTINKIGFFNPRKNICYWTDPSFIPQSVISIVSREVIGY